MAVENTVERIIKLTLDRAAAQRAAEEAKRSADEAAKKAAKSGEEQLNRLVNLAKKVAAAMAAAFAVREVFGFLKDSVAEANEAEAAWNKLAGTIENAGESFKVLEGGVRGAADAFSDATVHSGEDYAKTLDRLISLTGDVSASTNNMGFVADVAAQFFEGDLAPAAELVAKVMNGNTSALQRMGIQVGSAREGLEVLATRSFGAAAREAGTFAGRTEQLKNKFNDLKQAIGTALVSGKAGGGGVLDLLLNAVKGLTEVVEQNKDAIAEWAKSITKFALDASSFVLDKLGLLFNGFSNLNNILSVIAIKMGATGLAGQLVENAVFWETWRDKVDDARIAYDKLIASWAKGKAEGAPGAGSVGGPGAGTPAPVLTGQKKRMDSLNQTLAAPLPEVSQLKDTSAQLDKVGESAARLGEKYKILTDTQTASTLAQQENTAAMQVGEIAAWDFADGIGAAAEHGLGRIGRAKAKQLRLEALEAGIRAAILAFIPGAGAEAAAQGRAAITYAALAVLWSAIAGASPSGGGGGATSAAPTTASSSAPVTSARSATASAAAKANQPPAEVNIWLVGPGFKATNPEVQKVVLGAQEIAKQNYGNNVKVRVKNA